MTRKNFLRMLLAVPVAAASGFKAIPFIAAGGPQNCWYHPHSVVAYPRRLKATYTMELAPDLKVLHGLDAEAELANIINKQILQTIKEEYQLC